MKRVSKNLIASGLMILFAVGLLCASLSAPTLSFASQMPDCSTPGSVLDQPCQPLLCNLAASHYLPSQGALVSTRSDGSAKGGSFLIGDILTILSHNDILLAAKQLSTTWSDYRPEKVSIHLFNSVLIL